MSLGMAYSVKHKKREGYARGGVADLSKLRRPMGVSSAHDIVHMIMRAKSASPPPEYMAEGGEVDHLAPYVMAPTGPTEQEETPPDAHEQRIMDNDSAVSKIASGAMSRRSRMSGVDKTMHGPTDQEMTPPSREEERYIESESARGELNKARPIPMEKRMAARSAEMPAHKSFEDRYQERLGERPQMKAYGGEIEPDHSKDDFLSLEAHEGQEQDPKKKKRGLIDGIMRELQGVHFGK